MNTSRRFTAPACAAAFALAALGTLLGTSVPAAAAGAVPQTQAQYQRERVRCMKQREEQARADCLSEASTAYAGSQPEVVDPDPGRYLRNALIRCEPLREPDRTDCVARIKGAGTTSGSVAEGGIYRELVTIEPAATPTSAAASTVELPAPASKVPEQPK